MTEKLYYLEGYDQKKRKKKNVKRRGSAIVGSKSSKIKKIKPKPIRRNTSFDFPDKRIEDKLNFDYSVKNVLKK